MRATGLSPRSPAPLPARGGSAASSRQTGRRPGRGRRSVSYMARKPLRGLRSREGEVMIKTAFPVAQKATRILARTTLAGLLLLGVQSAACGQAYADPTTRVAGLTALCPCTTDPFFEAFVDGERALLACTDDTPIANFVRLVATNIDLVVLFEFPPQKFCGWQPVGENTSYLPITTAQFQACRRLVVRAAGNQRLRCLPES